MGLVHGEEAEDLVLAEMVAHNQCTHHAGHGNGRNRAQGIMAEYDLEGEKRAGHRRVEAGRHGCRCATGQENAAAACVETDEPGN